MREAVPMHVVLGLLNSISNHHRENDVFSSSVTWHIRGRSAALRVSRVPILLIPSLAWCLWRDATNISVPPVKKLLVSVLYMHFKKIFLEIVITGRLLCRQIKKILFQYTTVLQNSVRYNDAKTFFPAFLEYFLTIALEVALLSVVVLIAVSP